ncbi:class I adenylate-forming enzyme family protein [Sphingomonas sp. 28-63-12]|uniref:class I adenylate-forming enzyme family protein n=1 Tax=Sphingomonas sp. 28-63-12 TaxID=1970434 RepID=UPI000BDBDB5B|nr:MAG: AMP-dependent synthetase [Sphingomonas sp. 28-63-12]
MKSPPIATLGALLQNRAAQWPDQDALVFPDRRETYGEMTLAARRWAKALIARGVQPGDHVGILLTTRPEFMDILFGIAMAGAVCVPVNARYQPAELAFLMRDADLVCLITTGRVADSLDFGDRLLSALPSLGAATNPAALAISEAPRLGSIICVDDPCPGSLIRAADALAAGDAISEDEVDARIDAVDPDSIALILYTSGTTANPKGCMIRHRGIVGNSRNLARRYAIGAGDRFWSPLPIFHIAGILPMVAIVDAGGAYLTIPSFDAGVALDMLEREKATHAYPCFVTIMQDLIAHPHFATTDLSNVRLMNANFAVQPDTIRTAMSAAMPHTIMVGTYGLTEGAGTICTSRPTDSWAARGWRLGVPLDDWEVRIVNAETGIDCPIGAEGEIIARGPNMLAGYYNAPDKTAEVIDADGWFHTGDIGSFDAEGQIMFHGRTKDMLKVGGENVAAAEIEAVLHSHPAVKLAQVVGIPHPRYVEVPAAFVELHGSAIATEAELIEHCTGKLASFKLPRHIRFVTSWPMSTSKIQKFRLRDALVAELTREDA